MNSCETKQMILDYFGHNLEKALESMVKGCKDAQKNFIEKYPHANMSEFGIFVNLNKDGTINNTEAVCTADDHYNIISDRTPYNLNNNDEPPLSVAMDSTNRIHCTRCNECT